MARLRRKSIDDSEDDLPDLADIIGKGTADVNTPPQARKEQSKSAVVGPKQLDNPSHRPDSFSESFYEKQTSTSPAGKVPCLNSASNQVGGSALRQSPQRAAKKSIDYSKYVTATISAGLPSSEDDEYSTDLSGFIVSDSDSALENVHPMISRKQKPSSPRKWPTKQKAISNSRPDAALQLQRSFEFIDLSSPKRHVSDSQESSKGRGENSRRSSDACDNSAIIKFSPPRSKSPQKRPPEKQAINITPPDSPSKSKLQSPSKKIRAPPTPHRPSIDAFWSQEVINDWYDAYSPQKTPSTNRRKQFVILDDSENDLLPSFSPSKRPSKSPNKRDKSAIDQQKAFNENKQGLAVDFLAEVDRTISDGEVAKLSESTGGVQLLWSKTLNSTAGRANWRRQTKVSKHSDGSVTTTYHHHASIELAEKVIDDERRLLNVIAHEYCHLANFMISGVKNNPHGKEFKQWAAKCTKAFGDRGVEVTTKHTYNISYKYMWACSVITCGVEYKRHSKSIDPVKHRCGSCKGTLVQIKPVPRKGAESGKRSEYQDFVKTEYERVKGELPGAKFGQIMAALGKEFREQKKQRTDLDAEAKKTGRESLKEKDIDDVFGGMEALNLNA